MKITTNGIEIFIRFKYDPRLVQSVRALPGRRFDKTNRQWVIPKVSAPEFVRVFSAANFYVPDVIRNLALAVDQENALRLTLKDNADNFESSLPLYPFQKIGARFLALSSGALLGDQPSLGKTLQALAACDSMGTKRHLVICPKSLIYQWKSEGERWLPDAKFFVVEGKREVREKLYKEVSKYKSFYLIMGYETARIDYETLSKM